MLHGFDKQQAFTMNGAPVEFRIQASQVLDPLADLEYLYFDKQQFRTLREKETARPQKVLVVDNAAEVEIAWQ